MTQHAENDPRLIGSVGRRHLPAPLGVDVLLLKGPLTKAGLPVDSILQRCRRVDERGPSTVA